MNILEDLAPYVGVIRDGLVILSVTGAGILAARWKANEDRRAAQMKRNLFEKVIDEAVALVETLYCKEKRLCSQGKHDQALSLIHARALTEGLDLSMYSPADIDILLRARVAVMNLSRPKEDEDDPNDDSGREQSA